MSNPFFERTILNSPYSIPTRQWELDETGQPTQRIIESRRVASFITPIPKPKKRVAAGRQTAFLIEDEAGVSTAEQQYDTTSDINQVRSLVTAWRSIPS